MFAKHKTILWPYIERHQKGDRISTITFYKPTYSSDSIGVALMTVIRYFNILLTKLQLLNNSQEISIALQDFNLNALDSKVFE